MEINENLLSASDGNVLVEWENLGEGICGDYNPEDPDDVNYLRFYVSVKYDGEWVDIDDASYCTMMPADTDREILVKALKYLLSEFSEPLNADPYCSVKSLGERLSWISPDWFKDDRE